LRMRHEPSVCLTREATPLQVLLSCRQEKHHVELSAGLHVQQPTELTREFGRAFMVFLHVRRSSLPVRPRKVTCPELLAQGTLADIFGCPFGWCFASTIARCGRPFDRPPLKPPPFACRYYPDMVPSHEEEDKSPVSEMPDTASPTARGPRPLPVTAVLATCQSTLCTASPCFPCCTLEQERLRSLQQRESS